MLTTVREDQILLRNGQVVNKTTVERWRRQAHVGKLLRPFRTEVSRARKKREARLANRKKRRDIALHSWRIGKMINAD